MMLRFYIWKIELLAQSVSSTARFHMVIGKGLITKVRAEPYKSGDLVGISLPISESKDPIFGISRIGSLKDFLSRK